MSMQDLAFPPTIKQHVAALDGKKRAPKYRNKKTVVDGITFDSKKEAIRYSELKLYRPDRQKQNAFLAGLSERDSELTVSLIKAGA